MPHQAVGRVLNTSGHHVVAFDVAQSLQGLSEGGGSRPSNTESKNLHRDLAVALSPVNAGIICENIGPWLRSQVIGVNQRHGVSVKRDD